MDSILDLNPDDLKALNLLATLEQERAKEFLSRSETVCLHFQEVAGDKSSFWYRNAAVQLMRTKQMMGDFSFISTWKEQFEHTKSAIDFNFLMIALGQREEYEEIIRWCNEYLETFTQKEQLLIIPNLMEAAYQLKEIDLAKRCFESIITDKTNQPQIFNAWWLLWKTFLVCGRTEEAQNCHMELLSLLPKQGYNEYTYQKMLQELNENVSI